ncbi:MAG TPA: alpha/beta hydrolase-fold protein [Opitutaceae bacterium]|nr:alpha/beta hydrolase-fold protein [Opitutaceae bacterium]HND60136.1 alpha/beta hydrolase-fold protein [Opitutaceae bacterium]
MTREELAAEFPLGPDSLPQPGVPCGRIEPFTPPASRVFPGTVRDCWIYVPAQYDPSTPACVLIVQDGAEHLKPERRWHIPTVLDNLIHRQEIPVTIGVFINPGTIPAAVTGARARDNRSFEYDSRGDAYARFLLEEILPEVARRYRLRSDAGSRCLMGGSSGAVCAFNAAWERPREFGRVLSIVGSYTALRGAHDLPLLVRITEPKPLRVFLQSGANDLRVFAGDWWTANLEMLSALTYAGYEVEHVWAEHAGHDEFHGSMVFPAALRWVWRNHPAPISAGANSLQPLQKFLCPGEGWQLVPGDYERAAAITADSRGRVVFADPETGTLFGVAADGAAVRLAEAGPGVAGLACGTNGEILATRPEHREIVAIDAKGAVSRVHDGIAAVGIDVAATGVLYVTEPSQQKLWRRDASGDWHAEKFETLRPWGTRLSADQGRLVVTSTEAVDAQVYTVRDDGSLADGAPYYRLHRPAGATGSGASELAAGRPGWILFAASLGLQLGTTGGLIAGLIALPEGTRAVGVAVGGADGNEIYLSTGRQVFRRRIRPEADLWG